MKTIANGLATKIRDDPSEFGTIITQLAAAQVVTEEKLQSLIAALRLEGNGHS